MFRVTILIPVALFVLTAQAQADEIRFNRDIRPLLSEHCFACHGPDSSSREADLRLDTREGALASEVVVPGDAQQSELIARITSSDPDLVMPPSDSGEPLTPKEQQLLADWINSGAEWEKHWAFIKPVKVDLPQPDGIAESAENPIDHFVVDKLNELGLNQNLSADRHTLARRTALHLTGLPPDAETLDAFVADATDDAFEKYVNALLSSRQAGEHRARYWLDAARYGDTHGMHIDNYREIWPYRDWVIRSFTENRPFDQFVTEQIAGDLLPQPTLDQRIATGFSRCNITTSEGGAIPEELNVRYMVDRVETTATVFLGLTAGCAVCHDHKFDPLSQREFYQLGAFFNNTTQPAMDGNQKDTPPVVCLPKDEFKDEWQQLAERRQSLQDGIHEQTSAAADWWANRSRDIEHPISDDRLSLWMPLTEEHAQTTPLPPDATWADDHPAGRRGVRSADNSLLETEAPELRTDEPFSISFWFRTPDQLTNATLFNHTTQIEVDDASAKDDDAKKIKRTVGWKLGFSVRSDMMFSILDAEGGIAEAPLPDNEALRPRKWQHLCIRYSGGQSESSIAIFLDGRLIALRRGDETLLNATQLADAPLRIFNGLATAGLSDLRIYRRWVNDEEIRLLARDYVVRRLINSDQKWAELDEADQQLLTHYYNEAVNADRRKLAMELAESERRRDFIYARSTTTLVMQERPTVPRAWVLARGEYDQRRDEVAADVPAVLPPLREGVPRNRLELARWLVDPDHPLTARVTVNRLWQSVFGMGLVKTSEDFGVMGEQPSHPELLDWLAAEFVASGWDVNHMLRLIVTSNAYRQSSRMTPEKVSRDPDNRFLSRGPRLRLDAEVLRDQALAVSGLLNRTVGGPSVRPYQPDGLWKVVAVPGSNTEVFQQDSGNDLYRRSLYTFWKRTSPPPAMAAFNAPTREQCTVRRERTNTPLQALVMMNDTQYVEAARHLAWNTLQKTDDNRSRAAQMLSTVFARPAAQADVDEMTAAAAEFRRIFENDREAATKLIQTGDSKADTAAASAQVVELAAWTMVANTIMNRDDFINSN